MSFIIRGIEPEDLKELYELASQFHLLNMPANRSVLTKKIENSVESFAGRRRPEKAEYLFVVVDPLARGKLCGCSQIIAKHGTPNVPHYSFEVLKVKKMSEELGVGFIHKVLRFKENSDGPSEIGGLLVDKSMRSRPEKLGKQISLIRFLYMAMHKKDFQKDVLCELTPPLLEDGRSEFWEAIGRRFTGLPYQEADELSQTHKEFIKQLFPTEDIFMCLIEARARLSVGKVGHETLPAQNILEKIGFKYLEEVDPFDGGPHFGAKVEDISVVKNTRQLIVKSQARGQFNSQALVASDSHTPGKFIGAMSSLEFRDDEIILPETTLSMLSLDEGEKVFVSPLNVG